jgi:hypothetical protein
MWKMRRPGVGGPVRPKRQGTEAVIQNKSVNELEDNLIDMAKVVRFYLMRWMHWPTGISSSRISFATRLPQLSSLAMDVGLDLEEEREENCYMILESRKAMGE